MSLILQLTITFLYFDSSILLFNEILLLLECSQLIQNNSSCMFLLKFFDLSQFSLMFSSQKSSDMFLNHNCCIYLSFTKRSLFLKQSKLNLPTYFLLFNNSRIVFHFSSLPFYIVYNLINFARFTKMNIQRNQFLMMFSTSLVFMNIQKLLF